MTATASHAERYIAAWNAIDPAARRAAVEELFSPDATFTDPLVDVEGRDAIEAAIASVQQQFPGFVFTLAGPADAHHDQLRYTWHFGPEGVEPPIVGFDVAVVDADGRIRTVLGFLDRVPAAA